MLLTSHPTPASLQGGDIPDGNGSALLPQQLATVKQCCQACQALPACGAYVYSTVQQMCYFKVCCCWARSSSSSQCCC